MGRLVTSAPALVPAVAVLVLGVWAVVHSIRSGRTRRDRFMAQCIARVDPPTEDQAPGTDLHLLIDAELAYGDTEALQRLAAAIHQHRKENPQP